MISSLPKHFLEKVKKIYTKEEQEIIFWWFQTLKRPTTFRVNTLKSSNQEIENILNNKNISYEKIPFLSNGYMLIDGQEKDLWDLDIFRGGKIYLQWISSQLVWEILKKDIQGKELKVLDLTAAPGGKTSHISAMMWGKWEIIANEMGMVRREKLKFTLERQWVENAEITPYDGRDIASHFETESFDLIIADLPCSAEWRVNLHHEKSYKYLEKPGINKKNYLLQKSLLESVVPLLSPGWILLYSTCTLDPQENEGMIHFLLSNYKDLEIENLASFFENTDLVVKPGIKSFEKYIYNSKVTNSIRMLPTEKNEGFFIGKLRKIKK